MGSSSRAHNVVTALVAGSFALVSMVTNAVAEYNCSKTSIEQGNPDFFVFIKASCNALETGVGKHADHTMHVNAVNPKTNQTLYMWADCSLNQDETFCTILSANLLMVCRNSSWGDINIDNDCSIHYNASDYTTPGDSAVPLMLLGDNLIRACLDFRVLVALILTTLLVLRV